MSLEELRQKALAADDEDPFSEYAATAQEKEDLLFGLNSVERMFLSIGLFMVVSIFSFLLLVLTSSVALR